MDMDLSFLTWNIWFNEIERSGRAVHILGLSNDLSVDFVAYQEVVRDSCKSLMTGADKIGYHYIGAPLGQRYDTVILSKYPCVNWSRYVLPRTEMGRNLLIGEFLLPDNRKVHVGTFHLESVFQSEDIKLEQLAYIEAITPPDCIFMGDTNLITNGVLPRFQNGTRDIFEVISEPMAYQNTYSGATNRNISNRRHNSRLDRVYVKGYNSMRVDKFFLVGTDSDYYYTDMKKYLPPSDHYGVFTTLKF